VQEIESPQLEENTTRVTLSLTPKKQSWIIPENCRHALLVQVCLQGDQIGRILVYFLLAVIVTQF
jgi:hypothetical protein